MDREPRGQWICGLTRDGAVRCLTVVMGESQDGARTGRLMHFDGASWLNLAQFVDQEAADETACVIQELVESPALARVGGPQVMDGAHSGRPGVEWIGMPGESEVDASGSLDAVGSVASVGAAVAALPAGAPRLRVMPMLDGSVVGMTLPGRQRNRRVAFFPSMGTADLAVGCIGQLFGARGVATWGIAEL